MTRRTIIIALVTMAATLAGCSDGGQPNLLSSLIIPAAGTQRVVSANSFAEAFSQGRGVMNQYFAVSSADRTEGMIRCLPKRLDDAPNDRIVGSSQVRQVATLQIVERNGQIAAICSVQMQRQSSSILRQQAIADSSYDSVPNQTPAEVEAASTPDQNDTWETYSSDQGLENQILNDLERALDVQ